MSEAKFLVLMAEDLANDRFLLKRAIEANAPRLQIVAEVETGEQVIAYLSGKDKYADRALYAFPDLLLLDLNMPVVDGFEVLKWLQTQSFPSLKVAIVADVLTQVERQKALSLN